MRKSIMVVLGLFLATGNAFALLDNIDNSTNTSSQAGAVAGAVAGATAINGPNINTNIAEGGNGGYVNQDIDSDSYASNRNDIDNRSSAYQGQDQDQDQYQGQSQNTKQANGQTTNVDASDNNKVYASNLQAASAHEGTSLGAVSTPFGGINLAGTEDYKKVSDRLKAAMDLKNAGVMSDAVFCKEIKEAYLQLRDASQPNRLFNSGAVSRGQNIWNLFGLVTGNTAYTNPDKFEMGCE